MQRGLLTGIVLGVAMTIFALQNPVKVLVKFLWFKFTDVPLALILVISILTGISITAVFAFIDKRRLRVKIKKLQNRVRDIEAQVSEEGKRKETADLISDDGLTIEGEPGNKFFEY